MPRTVEMQGDATNPRKGSDVSIATKGSTRTKSQAILFAVSDVLLCFDLSIISP